MKKIIFALFCSFSTFIFAFAAAAEAETPVIASGTTNADFLNMRLGPGLKYPVAGKIANGTEVQITKKIGNWLEIKAPEALKVYVSEARVNPDGTLVGELNMRSAMSVTAPCFGTLPAKTKVTRLNERANGWVRITPPAHIKVYVSAFCVNFDQNKVEAAGEKKAEETNAALEAKPVVENKPAAEEKKTEEPVKTVENKHQMTGHLIIWKFSRSKETAYALLDAPEGRNQAFIVAANPELLTAFIDKKVVVSGDYTAKTDSGAAVFHANTITAAQ